MERYTMEVHNGGTQWRYTMEVHNGGTRWRYTMEVHKTRVCRFVVSLICPDIFYRLGA
jgi:hypothetical protein